MKLVNSSAVAVKTLVAEGIDPSRRAVLGIAKATFTVSDTGAVTLDRQDPMPIYTKDVETRYGVLPKEDIPRLDPVFEVMTLGSAIAPTANPVEMALVELQVGHVKHALQVFGDRQWSGTDDNASISPARPFTRMPLGWHLAFGGTEEVEIDKDSFVDVSDPINPLGKGFDHVVQIEQLAQALKCPDPYPQYRRTRQLANIESADTPVTHAQDKPLPVCWAPCDISSGIIVERLRRAGELDPATDELRTGEIATDSPFLLHRAHPDWVIDTPVAEAMIRLTGMSKTAMEFSLPSLRVLLDVTVGDKERALELHPGALTLFPDLNKFTLVFRGVIPYRYRASDTRVAQVRLETGWVPSPINQLSTGAHQ